MKNKDQQHQHGPLGIKVAHSSEYDPGLLFPICRSEARQEIQLASPLPFYGEDIWNAYELSWLSVRGLPQVAVAAIRIPADSVNIVESKSMKLYLGSFNQCRFDSVDQIKERITADIAGAVQGRVTVSILLPDQFSTCGFSDPGGTCIDGIDIAVDCYHPDADLLTVHGQAVSERLYSNLLRTRCPVTDQPDWATVIIDYSGQRIDREGLLRYLVSFREHNGFHENCVERIFADISRKCQPKDMTVRAQFTRRGGIDINPVRSSSPAAFDNIRLFRQ